MRLGGPLPKALHDLAGEPLLVHCCRNLLAAPSVGSVVIAAPADALALVAELVPEATVVAGGATRQESVAAALGAVPDGFDIVLVHDAARALTPPTLVESVADAVRSGHDAVIPGLPVVDTIKQVAPGGSVAATVDRSQLRAVQTPQGFRRSVLVEAHRGATDALTDDAGLVESLGVPVQVVPGHPHALKITTAWDLMIAQAVLSGAPGV